MANALRQWSPWTCRTEAAKEKGESAALERARALSMIGGEPFTQGDPQLLIDLSQSGCVANPLGPNLLLTAAHCAVSSPVEKVEIAGHQHDVSWTLLPDWSLFGDDIALGRFLTREQGLGQSFKCDASLDGTNLGDWVRLVARDESGTGWATARAEIVENQGELILSADGVGVCPGDSGAPVFMEVNSRLHLVGLVSAGPPGCEQGPIYVTPIGKHFAWLEGETETPFSCDEASWAAVIGGVQPQAEGELVHAWQMWSNIAVSFNARSVENYRHVFVSVSDDSAVRVNESFAAEEGVTLYDVAVGTFTVHTAISTWSGVVHERSFQVLVAPPSPSVATCSVQSWQDREPDASWCWFLALFTLAVGRRLRWVS